MSFDFVSKWLRCRWKDIRQGICNVHRRCLTSRQWFINFSSYIPQKTCFCLFSGLSFFDGLLWGFCFVLLFFNVPNLDLLLITQVTLEMSCVFILSCYQRILSLIISLRIIQQIALGIRDNVSVQSQSMFLIAQCTKKMSPSKSIGRLLYYTLQRT